ncbi:MAG: hypothetical protein KAW93_08010, partial [Methanogenium sp.]|nr:hypothetical protein [Methanogenium sp.]
LSRLKLKKLHKNESKARGQVRRWTGLIKARDARIEKKKQKKIDKKTKRNKKIKNIKSKANRTVYQVHYIKDGFTRKTSLKQAAYNRISGREVTTQSGYAKILDAEAIIEANSLSSIKLETKDKHTLVRRKWIDGYTEQTYAYTLLVMAAGLPLGFLISMLMVWVMKQLIMEGMVR